MQALSKLPRTKRKNSPDNIIPSKGCLGLEFKKVVVKRG